MNATKRILPILAILATAPAVAEQERFAAYVITDGTRVETPFAGAEGDAARGKTLFDDPATGGCAACHAVRGAERASWAPEILVRMLPPPDPPPKPPEEPEEPVETVEIEGASELAPAATPLPVPRPDPEAIPEAVVAEEPEIDPRVVIEPGPDLDGIATRRPLAELRLLLANPRALDHEARMPAYHDVSLELAQRAPDFRQPWLSAQEVEDILAYLMTLDAPAATGK